MPYTKQQLLSNAEAQINYHRRPVNWEGSSATHWVSISIAELPDDTLFDYTENEELISLGESCPPLYSELPYRPGAEIISGLNHKTLIVVEEERVGRGGEWHFVSVVDTNSDVNGLVGYISRSATTTFGLPTPESNDMVFDTCIETVATKIDSFCSLTSPQWYETSEPYFDSTSCEYFVSITTTHGETGGDALQSRMDDQIPIGVKALLEYYGKPSKDSTINRLLNRFKFAKASSWWMDPASSDSRLKVLVSVHAKYFDAIAEEEFDVPSSAKNIFIQARTFEMQINAITDLFKRYAKSYTWKSQPGSWAGPAPEYGTFDLNQEATNLQLFLSNFKRLLTLNALALNPDSNDSYEIAVDEEFNIRYILANSTSLGPKYLTVGMSTLINTNPFNYPRTVSYVSNLSEMYNQVKKSKELPRGWKQLINDYTTPKPTWTKKSKKCDPNKLDSWECVKSSFSNKFGDGAWGDFEKWREWGKIDFKCESISPDKRQLVLPIANNPTVWNAVKSGAYDDYKLPWAPFVTEEERSKILTTIDAQDWLRAWHQHGGPDSEFTGDPWQGDINKIVKEIISPGVGSTRSEALANAASGAPQAAEATLNRLYTEALSKIDIKEKIRIIADCICHKLEEKAIWLEHNGLGGDDASALEADIVRAHAAFIGCGDICKVIPLLCICLPFEWPPRFTFPDKFPIVDFLAYLMTLLLSAIIDFIIQFIVQLLVMLLDFSWNCETKLPPELAFSNTFKGSYDEFDAPDLNKKLRQNNLPANSLDPEILNRLVKDTSTLLRAREFCSLLSGNADLLTMQITEKLITENYPEVRAQFSTTSRVRNLYTMLGEMIDTDICENLVDLMDITEEEGGSSICEQTNLRENMLDDKATPDQIRGLLAEAARCDASKLEGLIDLAKKSAGGEDFAAALIPAILQDPANPDGILPREPPPIKFFNDIAKDTLFSPIEKRYNRDYNYHPETLAPYRQVDGEGEDDSPTKQLLGAIIPNANKMDIEIVVAPTEDVDWEQWLSNERDSIFTGSAEQLGQGTTLLALPDRWIWGGGNFYNNPAVAQFTSATDLWKPNNSNISKPGIIPSADTPPDEKEKRTIIYQLCPSAQVGSQWDRILDGYRVEATRPYGPDLVEVYFAFNGEKLLTQKTLAVVTDENFGHSIRGLAPPPAEALNNYLLGKWMLLPRSDHAESREDLEQSENFMDYHMKFLHPELIQYALGTVFDIISEGKFLKGTPSASKELIIEADFSVNPRCNPRPPGLLDVDDLRRRATDYAARSLKFDPERNTEAMIFGLAMTYMKIFLVELLLDSIFVFSQFRLSDIAKSDLLFRYFINRFKERSGVTESNLLTFGGGFVEQIPMFEDIVWRIETDMKSRKYEDDEEFLDPFTGQPVNVILASEKLVSLGLQPTEESFKSLVEGSFFRKRTEASGSVEAMPPCLDPFDPETGECIEVGDVTYSNLSSIDSIDPSTGRRNIGFLEYVIKDQLKSMSGEYETVLDGPTLPPNARPPIKNEIGWLEQLTVLLDVPKSSPVGPGRFFLSVDPAAEVEAFIVNEDTIREVIRDFDLAEVYWAWGVMLAQNTNIHNFVLADVDREGQRFMQAMEFMNPQPPLEETVRVVEELGCSTGAPHLRLQVLRAQVRAAAITGGSGADVVATKVSNIEFAKDYTRGSCDDQQWEDQRWKWNITYDVLTTTYPGSARIETFIANRLGGEGADRMVEAQEVVGSSLSCPAKPFTVKPDFCKAGLRDHGGFILEKFIKITDHSVNEWRMLLGEFEPATRDLVEQKIKNRDSNLFGVVNLKSWNVWLRSLIEFHEELGLFTTIESSGEIYFNIEKYFKKWEVGTRLTFVYPLEDSSDERVALNMDLGTAFTDQMFTEQGAVVAPIQEEEGGGVPMETGTEDFIRKNKSHLLREDLSFTSRVLLENPLDEDERVELEVERGDKFKDVKTLPLISALSEVKSEDINFPALHNNTRQALQACIESIERVFLEPVGKKYKEAGLKFNNYVLPYTSEWRPEGARAIGATGLAPGEFYYSGQTSAMKGLMGRPPRRYPPYSDGVDDPATNFPNDGTKWLIGPDGNLYPHKDWPGIVANQESMNADQYGETTGGNREYAEMVARIVDLGYDLFGFNVWGTFIPPGEYEYPGNGSMGIFVKPPGHQGDRKWSAFNWYRRPQRNNKINDRAHDGKWHYTERSGDRGEPTEYPGTPGSHPNYSPLLSGLQVPKGSAFLGRFGKSRGPAASFRCPTDSKATNLDEWPNVKSFRWSVCNVTAPNQNSFAEGAIYLSDFFVNHPDSLCPSDGDAWKLVIDDWYNDPDIAPEDSPALVGSQADINDFLYGPTLLETTSEWRLRHDDPLVPNPWYGDFVREILVAHREGLVSSTNFWWGHKWIYDWISHAFKGPFEELLEEGFPELLSNTGLTHPEIKEAMVALRDFMKKQMIAREADGETARSRCWAFDTVDDFDDDHYPVDGNIRLGTENCKTYDNLVFAIEQIEYFIGKIDGELRIPRSSIQFDAIHQEMSGLLKKQIVQDPQYEAVLEYMIPSSRLISLATIYNAEHISGLSNRDMMFLGTKDLIKELYNVLRGAAIPEWWNKKAKDPRKHWWQEPFELDIPLGLLLVPWKILDAILSIIPWLRDFLSFIMPPLPPYRDKKRRRPGCPEPPP